MTANAPAILLAPVSNSKEPPTVINYPLETMPLKMFCTMTGNTRSGIRGLIREGRWAEGEHYSVDGTGHTHIILSGYNKWTRQGRSA